MPTFKEFPRGIGNKIIEEPSEIHLPCVVIIDTSGAMAGVKHELDAGLRSLADALDAQVQGRVEFCVISFGDDARILVPFGPAYDFEVPAYDCYGLTAMHAAVDLGLCELKARTDQYKANNTAYYRPWMFLLTDGGANDPDNGSFGRLLQSQRDKHCTFFAVGIGEDVDKELLKSLSFDGIVLTASKENFSGAFVWLSNSLSRVPAWNRGQRVALANPEEYNLKLES